MKKLFSALRRSNKVHGAIAVLAGAVLVPAALLAWGPDRPTYTIENPAPHVTFNSITNNPNHGDERNFVQVRNLTDNGKFGENTKLVPGKEYEVYVYYHNNAATALNTKEYDYRGIAQDTRMKVQMPATVQAGSKARITGTVSASNAQPKAVWDEAYGANDTNGAVALRYVPNSAKVTSEGAVNGKSIDLNQLASANGALLGYDALDGKLPGCLEYSGYVTYRFKVDQPNFEVEKQVSHTGKNDWKESVDAKAGDVVDFRIHYKNTGTMTQENVSIRDDLPNGLSLVDGSAKFFSSKTNGAWKAISDTDALTTSGVDFGAFGPNGGMYVAFKARIAETKELECGKNTLTNRGVVTTKNGTKHDSANVVVERVCKEQPEEPKPELVKVCDTKTGKIVTVTKEESNDDRYESVDSEECKETAPVEEVPTELPQTGLSGLAGMLGLGSLASAAVYYTASRRI